MKLEEVQQEIDNWISQFKDGYWHPLANLARLTEEVGELARELNHLYGPKKRKTTEDLGDLELEIGDILFVLGAIANSQGIALDACFSRVLAKYHARDSERWDRK
jgi:NTP pyrophosphatase (non-canonical NTP hydrolase)